MASIHEFYQHQNVFVTGATGFLGRALLEKLLRSCSDVSNIYVSVRPKKGKVTSEQIGEIIDNPVMYSIYLECVTSIS
jgi:fatty acyl-CoA reductase